MSRVTVQLGQRSRAALTALQSAVDMDSLWRASVDVVRSELPQRCCALFSDIEDFEPRSFRYHVVKPRDPGYVPSRSLSVAAPYLARHPQVAAYSYQQILAEDPQAQRRRLDQEPNPEWTDFMQLAFWQQSRPQAVLAVFGQERISDDERDFLEYLHPIFDAGLLRLRALERERSLGAGLQAYLRNSAEALMFFDRHGNLLYQNTNGEAQCNRWNRALRKGQELEQLPAALRRIVDRGAFASASGRIAQLKHSELPGFNANIDTLHPAEGYVLSFDSQALGSATGLSSRALTALKQLTPSEQRVARLTMEGLRNGEIAARLCRSPRTVEFQLNSIFRKLGARNRVELSRMLS